MFARALPIVLLLGACSRAPDMATSKLVGTWRPTLNYFEAKKLRENPEWLDYCSKFPGMDPEDVYVSQYSITFGPDGAWSMPVSHDAAMRWRPVDESGDMITIEVARWNGGTTQERRYTFASPDEMTDWTLPWGEGSRYARVSRTK